MRSDEQHRGQGPLQRFFKPPIETTNADEDESTTKNSRRQSSYLKQEFPERVVRIAQEELVYPVRNDDTEHIYVVNLAQVQRLNLHTLRKELAEEVGRMLRTERMEVAQGRTIRRLMSEYCTFAYYFSGICRSVPSRFSSLRKRAREPVDGEWNASTYHITL